MQLWANKLKYILNHGTALMLKKFGRAKSYNADCLFVSFDKSLNNLTPASDLDICIWFWTTENNWFEDRYWGSKVSRHTTHQHLLGSIHLFTVSVPCFYCGTTFSCKFWKREDQKKKNECLESLPQIFAWRALSMFLVKKAFLKYGFEGKFSNVNLCLFYPYNQLMFSFRTFWLCLTTQIT